MQALGLIETRGLLPAIECADVMLKTAQVELVGKTIVGGGLVTIIVTGDVGAVKAAVEAGAIAANNISQLSLLSQHIIPRPHNEIECIVLKPAIPVQGQPEISNTKKEQSSFLPDSDLTTDIEDSLPNKDMEADTTEQDKTTKESINPSQLTLKQLCKEAVDAFVKEFGLEQGTDALKSFSVVKLRHLAREYKELGVAGRAISKANKDLLIQILQEYYKKVTEK